MVVEAQLEEAASLHAQERDGPWSGGPEGDGRESGLRSSALIGSGHSRQTLNVAVFAISTTPKPLSMVCSTTCQAFKRSPAAAMTEPNTGRRDGRSDDALRPFAVEWNPMGFALSSLVVRTGRTAVLCSVCLEEGVPRWRKGEGKGWLSAEYRLLPGSTPQRQRRELLKLSGRTQEIQRLIGRSLRAVLDMKALGERPLLIDCDVIQADAGTRTAAITGAWLALRRACDSLLADGVLETQPIRDQVAAVSVGLLGGRALLDLDYSEDSCADVDLNVVQAGDGRFLELQGTAEGSPFSRAQLNTLLDIAEPGLKQLFSAQQTALASGSLPNG